MSDPMRALILPAAALVLAVAVVLAGGRMLERPPAVGSVALDQPSAEELALIGEPVAAANGVPGPVAAAPAAERTVSEVAAPPPPSAALERMPSEAATTAVKRADQPSPAADPAKPTAASRLVEPAMIVPPELSAEGLQREAPREPLSQLSLALPPPPPPESRNPWAGKPLFRPVAVESGVFESAGYTVAIDGVKSVGPEETCAYEDTSWPCGAKARAAFRLWLRGRALVCQIPDGDESADVLRARCRLAKQDVGAWLVSNGWALAAPDGPYVQAEEKARAARIGIFGAPPDTSSVSAVPDAPVGSAVISQPIMTEQGIDPQPSLDAGSLQEFPPAPPTP